MSLIFVFTATKMEGGIVERLIRDKTHNRNPMATTTGKIGDNQILLVNTGMGPHNARAAAGRIFQECINASDGLHGALPTPDATVITGLAGSLVPSIGEADIVIYQNCLNAAGPSSAIPCSPELVESMIRSLALHGLQCKGTTGISSPGIAQNDQDRERLAATGASVVDMESFEIAACAASVGVPVAVIRSVSDAPGSCMPDLNRALNSASEFNRWALASVLAASPLATARLFRASRRAMASLECALETILSRLSPVGNLASVEAGHSGGLSQVQK